MNPVANPHGFKVNDAPLTEREYRLLSHLIDNWHLPYWKIADFDESFFAAEERFILRHHGLPMDGAHPDSPVQLAAMQFLIDSKPVMPIFITGEEFEAAKSESTTKAELIRIANKCGYRTFRCQDKDLIHFSDSWSRERLRKGLVALFGHLGLTAYG